MQKVAFGACGCSKLWRLPCKPGFLHSCLGPSVLCGMPVARNLYMNWACSKQLTWGKGTYANLLWQLKRQTLKGCFTGRILTVTCWEKINVFNSPGSQSTLQKSIPLHSGKVSGKVSGTQKAKHVEFEKAITSGCFCWDAHLSSSGGEFPPVLGSRGSGSVGMRSPMGLLAEECLGCVSAPSCAPQAAPAGKRGRQGRTPALAASRTPATLWWRRKPTLLPLPASPPGMPPCPTHRREVGARIPGHRVPWEWGALVPRNEWEQPKPAVPRCKQSAERMPADGAPAHAASLFGLQRLLLKVIILFGRAPCFLCPLVWRVELFTPGDLEDGVNGWGQAEFWVPAIKYVWSMVNDRSVE